MTVMNDLNIATNLALGHNRMLTKKHSHPHIHTQA